jgi:putative ABC transport system permease protein
VGIDSTTRPQEDMKPNQPIRPPAWAVNFLQWYCRPELAEDLEGDLHEYFIRNAKTKGANKAKIIYVFDVLKFLRLYTIRKPQFIHLLIQWIMLTSYIKTSGRNIVRNKLFSTINIVGLAISMSVGMLIIAMLSDVYTYNKFHEHHGSIYRVLSQKQYSGDKQSNFLATTSMKAGKLIEETFPQPEAVAIIKARLSGDVTWNNKTIPLSGYWTNPAFLHVFTFPILKGNASTALKDVNSIVLTEKSAHKLFGDEDALGKTVIFDKDHQYTVTGVLADIPEFSTIKFDMLVSLATHELATKDDKDELRWDNVWSTYVFMRLPNDPDLKTLQSSLDGLSAREDKTLENTHIELKLQPLDDIMMGESLNNEMGPVVGRIPLTILGGLAFVVILSACFNYTNLSIARSLKRTREVGIRKVIGAARMHLVFQFVVEAVIISLFALVVAFALFNILRPNFLSVEHSLQETLKLLITPKLLFYFLVFAIVTGTLAGIFPAIFFARVNVAKILKDSGSVGGSNKLTLRRILVVFQYTISVIFICATIAMYRQYKYFINYDLGFTTSNILNIQLQGNKADLIRKDLAELPEVKGISQSAMNPGIGHYWATTMTYSKSPNDSISVNYNLIDENYLPLHNHMLIAGRNFSPKEIDSLETEVIVNENVLSRFNITDKDPAEAIGEVLKIDGKDMQIIGVIKNFQYGKAIDRVNAFEIAFRYSHTNSDLLNVQIESTDILETYAKIEAIWKKHDDVHPFDAKFFQDQIEESFNGIKASIKVAGFLAFLAIVIASLGLLGMVVFTTQSRIKEISIRKILGANDATLLYLMGKGFVVMLSIAIAIGLPVTIIFFEQVALPNFGNHAPLSILEMVAGVCCILLIALAMIFTQAIKVTRLNPANVLKAE